MITDGIWPGWMSGELEAALARIDEGQRTKDTGKKWATVLILADGLAQGASMRQLLRADNGTCAESTWYGKAGRRAKNAWCKDGAITGALELAKRLAVQWESRRVVRHLEQAREKLAIGAPAAVQRMEEAAEALMGMGADAELAAGARVRAYTQAADIGAKWLDRADVATADKSGSERESLLDVLEELRELEDVSPAGAGEPAEADASA